jgi:hypothetical protein
MPQRVIVLSLSNYQLPATTNLAPAYDFGVRACPLRSGGRRSDRGSAGERRHCTVIAGPRRVHGLPTTAAALNIFDLSGSTGAVPSLIRIYFID